METTKKGPGRPKKVQIEIETDNRGIITVPADPSNIIEMVYCNQKLFKKMFGIFKSYDGVEVKMEFNKENVIISCHGDQKAAVVNIDCKKVNSYYCAKEIKVIVHRGYFEKIFANLDKFNYKFTFIVDYENQSSKMLVVVDDIKHGNYDKYFIDQITSKDSYTAPLEDYTKYPLSFSLSSKHFKKKINDIAKNSNIINIQKNGSEFLEFTYPKINQNMDFSGFYKDPKKIDLVFTLTDDDIITASAEINSIKPFSNSIVGDDVRIYVDNDRDLVMTTLVDKRSSGHVCKLEVYIQQSSSKNI